MDFKLTDIGLINVYNEINNSSEQSTNTRGDGIWILEKIVWCRHSIKGVTLKRN